MYHLALLKATQCYPCPFPDCEEKLRNLDLKAHLSSSHELDLKLACEERLMKFWTKKAKRQESLHRLWEGRTKGTEKYKAVVSGEESDNSDDPGL